MRADYERRMLRVLAHIEANLTGDLSLDTLAEVAALSRFHFQRVFTAMTGDSVAATIRRRRLHQAAGQLAQTDLPVAAIAASVGYANPRSFAHAFERSFGESPSAFRRAGRSLPETFQAWKGDHPMFPIDTIDSPGYRLAARSHKGSYMTIGAALKALSAIATARGLWPQVRGMIGVYYDDPDAVPEAELRSHAGLVLAEGAEMPADLEEVVIAAGRTAVMHHKGAYAGLSAAYKHLYGVWLPDSGEHPAEAPCYEIYLNNPRDTAPEDLLTDVCIPLRQPALADS